MHVVPLTIRHAQLGDAERLGTIQVHAWQVTYRGVMPDGYLDELNVDDRADYWRRQMSALLPGQRLKVIVDDGVVVGFAAAGPNTTVGPRASASCTPSTSTPRCGAVGSAEHCCAT
jgi:hypothetical protein